MSNLLRGVVFFFHVLPVLDRVQWFPVVLSSYCLQVVLGILWGTKAFVMDDGGEMRRCRGKLDAADATYLRCLMRRYGWEKLTRRWRCVIGPNAFHLLAMGTRSVYTLLGFCSRGYCILATRLHCKLCGYFTIQYDPVRVRELRDSRTTSPR